LRGEGPILRGDPLIGFAQVPTGIVHPIPIIGGTLQFAFAHGVLSTVRHADGTYTQRFTYRTGS
jgi:hypothetical protein